ncbi:2'-5' RNA ligase family protein [Kitasatospora sp. NPDC059327]|uniref:2'-5' RNA ligase family protein n=1 Tax=Kitasatospora sp. NPDC059327 TaxID=3346803 RepID=UPI0036C9B160
MLLTDSRAFPAEPPADLDSPEAITAHDQSVFDATETMKNHWDRAGWSSERRALYWFLTFPDDSALIGAARACQDGLDGLGLDLVPADGLHVTLARIGESADTSPELLAELVRRVGQHGLKRFEIAAHPLAGSQGAVRFTLAPWRPLVELHAALAVCGREAGLPGGRRTSSFRPHLSIAYNPSVRPAQPVIDQVSRLREIPPVPLEITGVDLVELRRETREYRWEVLHRLELQ